MSDTAKQLLLKAQAECENALTDIQHNMLEHADEPLQNAIQLGAQARENIDDNHQIALSYLAKARQEAEAAIAAIKNGDTITTLTQHARDAAINYGGAYYSL